MASPPPPPLGGGGGGGGGGDGGGVGIEMSGRFDRRSFETEGSSHADGSEGGAQPAMAGVIGASGSNTIRTRTMAERSRMQDMPDMARPQKEEVQNAAVMPARDTHQGEDSIVLHISPTAIANFSSEFEAEFDA